MTVNPGPRLEVAFAVDPAHDAGEISTDGEPATARSRLRIQLLVALLATLTVAVLQLALAQTGLVEEVAENEFAPVALRFR